MALLIDRRALLLAPAAAACAGTGRGPSSPAPSGTPWERIAHFFTPAPEWRGKFGPHRRLLKFLDGRPVLSADDWQQRRNEIRALWHEAMGPWPDRLDPPRVERRGGAEPTGRFTRHMVNVQVAPDRTAPSILHVPEGKGPF